MKDTREAGGFNWKNKKPIGLIKDLDPENQQFTIPDFGFCDGLNSRSESIGIWEFLYDNIRQCPKYERVNNFIKTNINEAKSME